MGINSDVSLSAAKTVALTADDTAITTTNASTIYLTSDSSTASSRTFTLGTGAAGQMLNLVFTSGSSNTCQLLNTGATKLVSDWTPLQYNTMLLNCDGTNWYELARANSTVTQTISVTLTADNQSVTVGNANMLLLGSDNTTAANRTFTLTAGVAGQVLTIVFTTGTSTTCELADTGTTKLSAAWTPLQFDSIQLISDGTNWVEVSRADN